MLKPLHCSCCGHGAAETLACAPHGIGSWCRSLWGCQGPPIAAAFGIRRTDEPTARLAAALKRQCSSSNRCARWSAARERGSLPQGDAPRCSHFSAGAQPSSWRSDGRAGEQAGTQARKGGPPEYPSARARGAAAGRQEPPPPRRGGCHRTPPAPPLSSDPSLPAPPVPHRRTPQAWDSPLPPKPVRAQRSAPFMSSVILS